MSDEQTTESQADVDEQTPAEPPAASKSAQQVLDDADPTILAEVTAGQLNLCTEVVPAALALRYKAAVEVPAGEWRRNAGASDPRVRRLEAPYRRTPIPAKKAAKATGSRRTHQKRS